MNHRVQRTICLFLLFFPAFVSMAQSGAINGRVTEGTSPVPFASVFIQALNKGTVTDANGNFSIKDIATGTYTLTISAVGYATQTAEISVPGSTITIVLTPSETELEAVTVEGKSDTQLVIENPIKSAVIDTKVSARIPSTMIELMNRSAGVRVRQTGGLGSNAGIIVNGFQDRAIRYFKDGVPMDYLGAGYHFSLVPVNQLDRLEVFKGVLPVSLGADALGGGLNMVTRKLTGKALEASYEIASFNTHRVSLNLFYPNDEKKYFVGAEAFFNYSDNNYKVTPELLGKEVRLFHNQFTHYYAEVYGGFRNTPWADELRIGLTGFHIDRQNQYGARMTQPFGAYSSQQYSVIPTLRYKKTFLEERLTIDQFLEANTITVNQVDTAGGFYDWYGNFTPSESYIGEASIRGSLSETDFSYFTSRTYLSYNVTPTQTVELNLVYAENKRVGHDPYGMKFAGTDRDVLSVPANYDKTVGAIGLDSRFFNGQLSNNFIIKFFQYKIEALGADWGGNLNPRETETIRWGAANAIKFSLGDKSFIRGSAEIATRLPEQDEIFGDGNLHVANFELVPEKSFNVNVGYYSVSRNDKLRLELNGFYRRTRDLILNVPYNILFNQNQNIENVRGIGFETDASYTILPWVKVNGNFTYQDFRLFDTGNSLREESRLQNTPYFFANLGLHATAGKLLTGKDKIEAYWFFLFVREYYLSNIPKQFEPDGFLGLWGHAKVDAPNVIPDQTVHTIGFTYFPFDEKFSAGMQVKNIFDAKAYDNFRIQNAGRSFHLKLTYNLN